VKVDHYDRGWFGSSARVSYSLPVAGQLLRFAVDYKVNQFAVPLQRWARTDYTITPLDATASPVAVLWPRGIQHQDFLGPDGHHLKADELHWGARMAMRLHAQAAGHHQTEEGKPMHTS
jgi:hypothetical protein